MENILGVDIGGSKIRMVVWKSKAELSSGNKPLKEWQSREATLENLKKGFEFFGGALGSAISKVGIGAPGLLDFKTGTLMRCGNLPKFKGLNLKQCLEAEVRADNDAKCFLRAEMAFGLAKNYKNVLAVIFGTGIGGAINSWQGRNSWAGEFGHMIIDKGKDWEKLYQETKNRPKEQEKINAIGLANLINVFNPEVIVLGGKGAKMPSKEIISKYLLLPKPQMPKIVLSKLGDNAVAIGAALLFS
ncbi:MAG: ROK family protein [Candidatus Pacebacteria bacterium]|nr:ROK family protein [Candidatus Paceibacterota bacterium]